MDFRNCSSCGKIFNYLSGPPICPACAKKIEEKFVEVKKYVYDHPNITLHELSAEMEVSVPQIHKWIREERLTFTEDSPIGIECEGCGANIKTGRFCNACKNKMINKLENVYERPNINLANQKKRTEELRKTQMRYLEK